MDVKMPAICGYGDLIDINRAEKAVFKLKELKSSPSPGESSAEIKRPRTSIKASFAVLATVWVKKENNGRYHKRGEL
jgi:hypothetical protein